MAESFAPFMGYGTHSWGILANAAGAWVSQWVWTDHNGRHGNMLLWRTFDGPGGPHVPVDKSGEVFVLNADGSISLDGYLNYPDGSYTVQRTDAGGLEEYAPPDISGVLHLEIANLYLGNHVWLARHAQEFHPPAMATQPFLVPARCVWMHDCWSSDVSGADPDIETYSRDVWYMENGGVWMVHDLISGDWLYLLLRGNW